MHRPLREEVEVGEVQIPLERFSSEQFITSPFTGVTSARSDGTESIHPGGYSRSPDAFQLRVVFLVPTIPVLGELRCDLCFVRVSHS